jgi:hypothetical protein
MNFFQLRKWDYLFYFLEIDARFFFFLFILQVMTATGKLVLNFVYLFCLKGRILKIDLDVLPYFMELNK